MTTSYIYTCDRCKKIMSFGEKQALQAIFTKDTFDLCSACYHIFKQEFMKGK